MKHETSKDKNLYLYRRILSKLKELIEIEGEIVDEKYLIVKLNNITFSVQRFGSTKSFRIFYPFGVFVNQTKINRKEWIEVVWFLVDHYLNEAYYEYDEVHRL